MKKLFLILLIFLINVSFVFSENGKPVIAVMDFYSEVLSSDELASVTGRLASELLKTGQFTIIEIGQRDSLLEEMKFSLSGLADEKQAIEIGAMLSAEGLVLGSVAVVDNVYIISAKLVETETGEILRSAEGRGSSFKSLINKLPRLSREIAGTEQLNKSRKTAFVCMGGGVVLAGAGTYFLINGSLKLSAVNTAWDNYISMTSGDIASAYDDYLSAYQEASDARANIQFIGGISGAAVGLGLIGLSTWMLLAPPEIENVWPNGDGLSFMAIPGSSSLTLAFRLSS